MKECGGCAEYSKDSIYDEVTKYLQIDSRPVGDLHNLSREELCTKLDEKFVERSLLVSNDVVRSPNGHQTGIQLGLLVRVLPPSPSEFFPGVVLIPIAALPGSKISYGLGERQGSTQQLQKDHAGEAFPEKANSDLRRAMNPHDEADLLLANVHRRPAHLIEMRASAHVIQIGRTAEY